MTRALRFPAIGARRALLAVLAVATTLLGAGLMAAIVADGGLTALEVIILALFVPTFGWIVVPFWTAVVGTVLLVLGRDPNTLARRVRPSRQSGPATAGEPSESDAQAMPIHSRVALVMPIHDENPDTVMARASAMLGAVGATGYGHLFDLHLLSDSRDAAIAEGEREGARKLRARHRASRVAYRRRRENTGRKAGNIAEFCDRCGDDYEYMVVLDADSLMAGATLVEMVRRMEANPQLGLLQTATVPVRARSFFARAIQFAGHAYGKPLAYGQAFWQGDAANYWGHNAIVRIAPFRAHAGLPRLSGSAPLGGAILSHDFVEAALLRRAGWQVVFDPTLAGSWEEVPASLPAYTRRDRRWAQGSLQHLRLLGMPGLHPASRLHFLFGAMAYLSSALWCLLLFAGSAYVLVPAMSSVVLSEWSGAGWASVPSLLAITALVLFLPKLLGLLATLVAGDGGARARFVVSAVLETVLSVLFAPILMVYHTLFVVQILAGKDSGWRPGARETAAVGLPAALRATAPAWILGVAWTGITLAVSPAFALWMSPIFAGLLLAPLLVQGTSGTRMGLAARRFSLLQTGQERRPAAEVAAVDHAVSGIPVSTTHGANGAASTSDGVMYNAERGLFDLRRGRILRLVTNQEATGASVLVLAVECVDDLRLRRLLDLGAGEPSLVVTRHRAAGLDWIDEDTAVESAVQSAVESAVATARGTAAAWSLPLERTASAADVVGLATDRRASAPAARRLRAEPASPEVTAALSLIRMAQLIPAVITVPVGEVPSEALRTALDSGEILSAGAEEVSQYAAMDRSDIVRVSEAPVPIPGAEASQFVLYREAGGFGEHVAVLVGDPALLPDPVPMRMHSACLTGDLFGSLRCDCGEQLRSSIAYFVENGGGVLLYLAQEGRGIGLGNKFRAYSLQETGLDTIDADGTLGFGADERDYTIAVSMLRDLGIASVELLTNNPLKVAALEEEGIHVVRRQPLFGNLNRHNLPYVQAKVERGGHWLRDMLAQPIAGD